jgi:hypothetical protein
MTLPIVAILKNTNTLYEVRCCAWRGYLPPLQAQGEVYQRPGGESGHQDLFLRAPIVRCELWAEFATATEAHALVAAFATQFYLTPVLLTDPWSRRLQIRISALHDLRMVAVRGILTYAVRCALDAEALE